VCLITILSFDDHIGVNFKRYVANFVLYFKPFINFISHEGMATTEDLYFQIPNGLGPGIDRFVMVVSPVEVFEMVKEVRTDFGHSMADGLDITSRPIVSI